MDDSPDGRRAAGIAASEAGRSGEAYRLLLPLAEAGDAVARGLIGSFMMTSQHRFEDFEQFRAGPAVDEITAAADLEQAARYLEAASSAGVGPATFNLAGMVVSGFGGGSWEQRKARAAELYALAFAQGFTAFGWLMNDAGPGLPYLDIIESHSVRADRPAQEG